MSELARELPFSCDEYINSQMMKNTTSEESGRLAYAIAEGIRAYKVNKGLNHGAFSVEARKVANGYKARCSFDQESTMTILYWRGTDSKAVDSLYNECNDAEICRLANTMLAEGFVAGASSR